MCSNFVQYICYKKYLSPSAASSLSTTSVQVSENLLCAATPQAVPQVHQDLLPRLLAAVSTWNASPDDAAAKVAVD